MTGVKRDKKAENLKTLMNVQIIKIKVVCLTSRMQQKPKVAKTQKFAPIL